MNFTLYSITSQALNWVLPKKCLQCDKNINNSDCGVCQSCYIKLPFQDRYCQRCGQNYSTNTDYCGNCLVSLPSFDRCFCPFKYESTIKDLICNLKYRERPELAKTAASLLEGELLAHNIERPDALIAVPMHISRLRARGYNHSRLIADHLSQSLDIPIIKNALVKTRETEPQAQQSVKQRKKNLNNSFSLNKKIYAKNVAVVDDVLTTGATAEEIAKILKKNGVDCVQVWGIAHTL